MRVFIYVYIFLEVCLLHHDSSDTPSTKNPLKKTFRNLDPVTVRFNE